MLEPSANAFEERGESASNTVRRVQIRGAALIGDDFSVFARSLANRVVLLVSTAALAFVQLGEGSHEGRECGTYRSFRSSICSRTCWLRRLRSI